MELNISADAPVKELVAAHNELADRIGEAPVSVPWKASKAKLVDRIEALKARVPTERETRGSVIGETILAMAADPTLSYEEIADSIRASQGTNTSAKSVASVVCIARKNGVEVPKRVRPKRANDET